MFAPPTAIYIQGPDLSALLEWELYFYGKYTMARWAKKNIKMWIPTCNV